MAKQEVKEEPKSKKVLFNQPFDGSLNSYKVLVTKQDLKKGKVVKELPLNVYDWIKKYKVCVDA